MLVRKLYAKKKSLRGRAKFRLTFAVDLAIAPRKRFTCLDQAPKTADCSECRLTAAAGQSKLRQLTQNHCYRFEAYRSALNSRVEKGLAIFLRGINMIDFERRPAAEIKARRIKAWSSAPNPISSHKLVNTGSRDGWKRMK